MASETDGFAVAGGTRLVARCRGAEGWAKEPCVMGIDEAGRGPVLGPMVYAAAYAPLSYDITSNDYNDSKQLTEAKRDKLFAAIGDDDRVGYQADILSAAYLSALMLAANRTSLNKIAEDSTCTIIQAVLDAGVNLTEVYVDTVGDAERYQARLSQRFNALKFTVCPKADALFPIVSAASIVAKVIRDRSLVQSRDALGLSGDLGTGYPHDTATLVWLREHVSPLAGFPPLVRFSWETAARMLAEDGGSGGATGPGGAGPRSGGGLSGPGGGAQARKVARVVFEADATRGDGDGGGPGSGGSVPPPRSQMRLVDPRSTCAGLQETSGGGRAPYFRTRRLQRVAEAF